MEKYHSYKIIFIIREYILCYSHQQYKESKSVDIISISFINVYEFNVYWPALLFNSTTARISYSQETSICMT